MTPEAPGTLCWRSFSWGCRHNWVHETRNLIVFTFEGDKCPHHLWFWIHLAVEYFDVPWLCCSIRDLSGKDSALVLWPVSVSWRWRSGLRCLSNIQMKGSGLRLIISISQLTFRTIYAATPPAAHSLSLPSPFLLVGTVVWKLAVVNLEQIR